MEELSAFPDLEALFGENHANTSSSFGGNSYAVQGPFAAGDGPALTAAQDFGMNGTVATEADSNIQVPNFGLPMAEEPQQPAHTHMDGNNALPELNLDWNISPPELNLDFGLNVIAPEVDNNVQVPTFEPPMAEEPQAPAQQHMDWNVPPPELNLDWSNPLPELDLFFGLNVAVPEASSDSHVANIEPPMAEQTQEGALSASQFPAALQGMQSAEAPTVSPQATHTEDRSQLFNAANAALEHFFNSLDAGTFTSAVAQDGTSVPLTQSSEMRASGASMGVHQTLAPSLPYGFVPPATSAEAPLLGGSGGLGGGHNGCGVDPRLVQHSRAVDAQNMHVIFDVDPQLIHPSYPAPLGDQPVSQELPAQPVNQTLPAQPVNQALLAHLVNEALLAASQSMGITVSGGAAGATTRGNVEDSSDKTSSMTPEGGSTPPTSDQGVGAKAQKGAEPAQSRKDTKKASDRAQKKDKAPKMKTSESKKSLIACNRCKARKIKCDSASPKCSCCAKAGVEECEYATSVRKRGRAKKSILIDMNNQKDIIQRETDKKSTQSLQIIQEAQIALQALEIELMKSTGSEPSEPDEPAACDSEKGKKND